ncbi:class I SAM-dependent methyltransferase [Heyndrickxia sp. MSNUG]|uniref:class I SAM-dependent methyltransferase n=1 Tax=Heyndrickxia sp. MSNUG TaxID=3136677 RepID=UPI003C2F2096
MKEIISKVIASSPHKMISYAKYMELALYHPSKGYYIKNRQKIGKGGDFYTTSNVSDIFGKLIGKWFATNIGSLDLPPFICEIGAGNGRFARAFISGWNECSDAALTYYIVEESPYHRELQSEALGRLDNVHVVHAPTYADSGMNEGLVFSNELFDAFPVHVIEKRQDVIQEVFITCENEQLIEKFVPVENEEIIAFLQEQNIELIEGQRIEIPLAMEGFIKSIAETLSKGIIITVDYGYTKEQWMEPSRKKGSLRGYYQHQMYHDVLQMPGEMDITSHVHFDALISQGEKYGLSFLQKKRQDEFLLSIGILQELENHYDPNPFSETSKKNRAIRSLIMPGSISQSFDVIIQGKGMREESVKIISK